MVIPCFCDDFAQISQIFGCYHWSRPGSPIRLSYPRHFSYLAGKMVYKFSITAHMYTKLHWNNCLSGKMAKIMLMNTFLCRLILHMIFRNKIFIIIAWIWIVFWSHFICITKLIWRTIVRLCQHIIYQRKLWLIACAQLHESFETNRLFYDCLLTTLECISLAGWVSWTYN